MNSTFPLEMLTSKIYQKTSRRNKGNSDIYKKSENDKKKTILLYKNQLHNCIGISTILPRKFAINLVFCISYYEKLRRKSEYIQNELFCIDFC